MSVTSGFFNSLNSDRRYNAEQMSAIFNGIIKDGIFASIGTAFTVSADAGFTVNIGIGRAWFDSIWVYNDAILPLTFDESEIVLDRIDAVVIEINKTEEVRAGSIKIVKGSPATFPSRPTLTKNAYVTQYPLAYVDVKAGRSSITQSMITSMIGTEDCPYITGILQVQSIDNIVAQWQAQWAEWYENQTEMGNIQLDQMTDAWNQWFSSATTENENEIDNWTASMKAQITAWFDTIQDLLEPDVAANLAAKLLELQEILTTLAQTKAMYQPLQASDGGEIQDSDGGIIEGTTVFYGDMNARADLIYYDNESTTIEARTVQGAIDELSWRKSVKVHEVIAYVDNWDNQNQNVLEVMGLKPTDVISVGFNDVIATDEQYEVQANASLRAIAQAQDSVTLVAMGRTPVVDLPIIIYNFGEGGGW